MTPSNWNKDRDPVNTLRSIAGIANQLEEHISDAMGVVRIAVKESSDAVMDTRRGRSISFGINWSRFRKLTHRSSTCSVSGKKCGRECVMTTAMTVVDVGTSMPKKRQEKITWIETQPQEGWFVPAKTKRGKKVWYLRFKMTGRNDRLYGPFQIETGMSSVSRRCNRRN